MKWLRLFAPMLLVVTIAFGDDITTTGGKMFSNVKVSRADALGVSITHMGGAARVLFSEMTEVDRGKYGYDSAKEAAFLLEQRNRHEASERAAAEAERQRQEEAERQQRAREKRIAAQEKARQDEIAREERARRDLFTPSGISVAAFHATRPRDTTIFRAKAHLSDYFNFDFGEYSNPSARQLYWSVVLETPDGQGIGHGYISKAGRGADLFALIQDGKNHSIVARVRYPPNSEDSSVFFLDDYQDAARQTEPEETAE